MSRQTRRNLLAAASVILMLFALSWAWAQYRATQPDPSLDNGVHSAIPGPPPGAAAAMRKMMEARRARGEGLPTPPPDGRFDAERARAAMAEVLTPEEQQAMRDGMQRMMEQRRKVQAALGPEESRQFEQKMRTRIRQFMQQNTAGPGLPPPPPGTEATAPAPGAPTP